MLTNEEIINELLTLEAMADEIKIRASNLRWQIKTTSRQDGKAKKRNVLSNEQLAEIVRKRRKTIDRQAARYQEKIKLK